MLSDRELAREYARTGSEEAFAEIVRRHGGAVYRCCLRMLGDSHVAEDAAQAVFVVAVEKRRSLGRVRSPGAWFQGVARKVALMARRTAVRCARHEEEAGMLRSLASQPRAPGNGQVSELMDREMERLPLLQREAVVLRYLEGHSEAESASIAGCPVGTLSRRASEGLQRLRRGLAGQGCALGSAVLIAALEIEAGTVLPGDLMSRLLDSPNVATAPAGGGSAAANPGLLAKGVMKAMFYTKMKIAGIVLGVLSVVGAGTPLAYRSLSAGEQTGGAKRAAAPASDTALGRLAASLKPGEMKELKTRGFNRDLTKSWYEWDTIDKSGTSGLTRGRKYGAQHMFNIMTGGWSNDGKWDPKSRRILYFGGGHYAAFKFVTYSADTNEWKLMPVPVWCDPRIKKTSKEHGWCNNGWDKNRKTGKKYKTWPRGHSYDCNAIWPEKRIYALTMWSWMRLYDLDKDQWLPSAPGFRTNSSGPCEAFPELGGFLCFSRPNQLCVFNPETRKKRDLKSIGFGAHGVMEYNPVHKVMIVGGGDSRNKINRTLYLVDREGKVKKLKPTPDWLRCTPYGKVMCDPVSGEYIVQGHRPRKNKEGFGKTWAFHPLKDEWKEIPKRRFPQGIAIPVNTYGVLVFCTGGQVFVYKHKPVWPDDQKGKAGNPGK